MIPPSPEVESRMSDEEIAKENDDREFAETRAALIELLPDNILLDRCIQAAINRAVRAVTVKEKADA